jgi:hypothetical protein
MEQPEGTQEHGKIGQSAIINHGGGGMQEENDLLSINGWMFLL